MLIYSYKDEFTLLIFYLFVIILIFYISLSLSLALSAFYFIGKHILCTNTSIAIYRPFLIAILVFKTFLYLANGSVTSMNIVGQDNQSSITLRSPSQYFWPSARRIISEFVSSWRGR